MGNVNDEVSELTSQETISLNSSLNENLFAHIFF